MLFKQFEDFRPVGFLAKDRGKLRRNSHKPRFEVHKHIFHNGFDVLRRMKLVFFQLQFVFFIFPLRPDQLCPLRVVINRFVAFRVPLA